MSPSIWPPLYLKARVGMSRGTKCSALLRRYGSQPTPQKTASMQPGFLMLGFEVLQSLKLPEGDPLWPGSQNSILTKTAGTVACAWAGLVVLFGGPEAPEGKSPPQTESLLCSAGHGTGFCPGPCSWSHWHWPCGSVPSL